MHIIPSFRDELLALRIHSQFRLKRGSKHIASRFALARLAALLRIQKVRTVLESGAGIGTITKLVLSHAPLVKVLAIEDNEFCIREFAKNVTDRSGRLKLSPKLDAASETTFDVVIVDGEVGSSVVSYVRDGTIVFAEGVRSKSRDFINGELKKVGLRCDFRNHHRGIPRYRWSIRRLGFPMRRNTSREPRKGCFIGQVRPISE